MSPDPPPPANMWRYSQAPIEYRELFPEAADADWVAHLPQTQRQVLEPLLLRWNHVYPVRHAELPDHSAVFCGAPRRALELLTQQSQPVTGTEPSSEERRAAVRVQLLFPSRYETHTEPKQVGAGHTIDLSSSGIAFTTESLLPTNVKLTLHMRWPVRLPGDLPIELRAIGRLARAEALKAAVQLDSVIFDIAK